MPFARCARRFNAEGMEKNCWRAKRANKNWGAGNRTEGATPLGLSCPPVESSFDSQSNGTTPLNGSSIEWDGSVNQRGPFSVM